MLNKRILGTLFLVMSMAGLAMADAAPEPGYTRVAVPLNIKPEADFGEYRFFLNSPTVIEEIALTNGTTTTISADGRGGVMKYTQLVAIPKASLADFAAPITEDKLKTLHDAIGDKKIEGLILLTSHSFDSYMKKRESKKFMAPVFVLKAHAEKKIEAVETKQTPANKTRSEVTGEDDKGSSLAMIIGGGLMSLALVFGGVWFMRRQKQA